MTLEQLNDVEEEIAYSEFEKCCGASSWVIEMVNNRPYATEAQLIDMADQVWAGTDVNDWKEAFEHHPKIGDVKSLEEKFASTAGWASGEQQSVATSNKEVIEQLAKYNEEYESKFGFIFIACATGKSAEEMLELLKARMNNEIRDEIRIAAAEQHKITKIRLKKLLS